MPWNCCQFVIALLLHFRYAVAHQICTSDTHTQLLYGSLDFARDNPDEPVPEETFTHSQLLWSSIIPYLLPASFSIRGILLVQFMCLTVFFCSLSPSFLWSTSWSGTLDFILHTFLHPIIVFFSQHMSIPSQSVLLYYRDYVV